MASGMHALDARGNGGGPAVGGLAAVDLEVVVREHGASHGRHEDGRFADAQLVDALGEQLVDDPVAASGAVVVGDVREGLRPAIDELLLHGFNGHRT